MKKFKFEHDGKEYEFENTFEFLNKFGWARKMRKQSQEEQVFTIIEEAAGEEALAVIDELEPDELKEFMKELGEFIENDTGANLEKS